MFDRGHLSDQLDAEHRQRLLESVLSGERSAADVEVQTAMRASDQFAHEVIELQRLQATLSQRAAEMREDLEHRDPELEDVVASAVRSRGQAPARVARRWWLCLAAAAILTVVVLAWPRHETPKAPQHLGGEFAVEETADGLGLKFHLSLEPEDVFVVRVFDENGSAVHAPMKVSSSTWVPAAGLVAQWPAVVIVEVEVEAIAEDPGALRRGKLRWQIR